MSIDPGLTGLGGGVNQTFTGGITQVGSQANKVLFLDELSPSERKDLLEMIYAAQNPILIPPSLYAISNSNDQIASIGLEIEQTKHDTIMTMLDTWIESVKKIQEETEKADLKRMIDGISIAFHSYQHSISPTLDNNFPTFSVGVVLGAIGVHEALLSTPLTQVAMNPIVDMATSAVPYVMGDMRAELGLIGTLVIFGYGLQYGAVASQAKNEAGQKFDEKSYARNFAEQVLSTISDAQFNAYLLAIVSQSSSGSEAMTDQGKSQSIAVVKLVLLASALAALYHAEAGKMTGQEFAAMIREKKGEGDDVIKFSDGDFKNNFIYLIRGYMTFLEPIQQAKFMEAMMEFFDKDPSISTLADPSKAFADMNTTLRREELQA